MTDEAKGVKLTEAQFQALESWIIAAVIAVKSPTLDSTNSYGKRREEAKALLCRHALSLEGEG
jgi:hypothetical protein